ncbi:MULTISPECIES: glycosyltransferase [Parabacteroides]|uniref:glycosyltransferase n=1 Tax=Parabacteroides leei TaxID=2939491 RepID=UPI00189A2B85|nr:glycosyltransferase [Parabacteroides goldsteinii]
MKVVQINATCDTGSIGRICVAVSDLLTKQCIENYILYTSGHSNHFCGIKYSSDRYVKWQALKAKLFGGYGFNATRVTHQLIFELESLAPDIVHLHNIHNHNCNIGILFNYLRKKKLKVYWTFHDCWAFTGYCSHFVIADCDKWKIQCHNCPQRKVYSWLFDRSTELYKRKKYAIRRGLDLTIITPSKWLAGLVKQSMFKDYPVIVINNGIDLSVFKPVSSDFKIKYGVGNKHIVLGVSFGWGYSKGLDVFIKLAERLPCDYQVVLVGTNADTDKQLPSNIISIHKTTSQQELAQIYSAADVFVNATRQDTYPTVNMEAIACGTPVVTFRTGGSPEIINEKIGAIVECNDVVTLQLQIESICSTKRFVKEDILEASKAFDQKSRFNEYILLYQ